MTAITYDFIAPANGKCVPIEALHDKTLSSKVLGDGVSIFPTDGTVVAPCNGIVSRVSAEKHAVAILDTERSLELLLGADIDDLMENPTFELKVQVGQKISAGDVLFTCDIDAIRAHGCQVNFPCIITNAMQTEIMVKSGDVVRGESRIMSCEYVG